MMSVKDTHQKLLYPDSYLHFSEAKKKGNIVVVFYKPKYLYLRIAK
jgi:hypothetical protein